MDRNKAINRSLLAAGRVALCAASILLASAAPATAAELEQHNDLVNMYVTTMHADPLVADCAAHGDFVASTSNVIDHVEFTPQSFDSSHATVTPWNDSFDERKQRVKVDTVVSVGGVGIPQNSNDSPIDLTFRCGYVGNQMLAFSWNDPSPPARAHSESSRYSARAGVSGHGRHVGRGKGHPKAGKGVRKIEHRSSAGKAQSHATKTSAKSSVKKTAKKKSSK
ncbi:MAG TPA: hypothetical protein VGG24_05490 [Paraburkholderia sp.]|jgi:hypothetical protein